MATKISPLLVFISLCNSLKCGLDLLTHLCQAEYEKWWDFPPTLSNEKECGLHHWNPLLCFLKNYSKGNQLLCCEILYGEVHMVTNKGRPQSNSLGGNESCHNHVSELGIGSSPIKPSDETMALNDKLTTTSWEALIQRHSTKPYGFLPTETMR